MDARAEDLPIVVELGEPMEFGQFSTVQVARWRRWLAVGPPPAPDDEPHPDVRTFLASLPRDYVRADLLPVMLEGDIGSTMSWLEPPNWSALFHLEYARAEWNYWLIWRHVLEARELDRRRQLVWALQCERQIQRAVCVLAAADR